MLIGDISRRNAVRHPAKVAVVYEGKEYTFKKLNDRANSLVNALFSLGAKQGDRVGVLLGNCYEFLELYCALPKGGLVAVPLNSGLGEQELAYIVNNAEARALIYGQDYQPKVESIKGSLETVERFIVEAAIEWPLPFLQA